MLCSIESNMFSGAQGGEQSDNLSVNDDSSDASE